MNGEYTVAIPARDEVSHIKSCLDALNAQEGARFDHIVLFVNNSADATASVARGVRLHSATRLHVIERTLPDGQANAGFARRLAMEAAAALAGPGGVLLTTDADGEVDPDWLVANLAALERGADAVAGWVELHPIDWGRIPTELHEDDARECAYDALCDEIHGRLDPDLADPLPRHTHHSGASIAVTASAFARCGGVPPVAFGEDRALIAALRRVDARVRHAPEVHVTVSGRIEGRALGGMADTIRRRLSGPDEFLDPRLEPAANCARRALSRAGLRHVYDNPDASRMSLATALGLSEEHLGRLLQQPYFGAAWEAVETASALLDRRRVQVADLPAQMIAAEAILMPLRPVPTGDRIAGRAELPP
jgi:GT2 family glycosyltransferase